MKKVRVVINFILTQDDEIPESAYQTLLDGREEAEELLTKQFRDCFHTEGGVKVTFDIEEKSHENSYHDIPTTNLH